MTFESAADLPMLNTQTLIGCVDQRGSAWHRRDDLMGDESNHYPGLIPIPDVTRRIFNWSPQTVQAAYLVPVGNDQGGGTIAAISGQLYRIVPSQAGRVGVLHGGTDYDLGVFKEGVQHPPYAFTLIEEAERLTGTTLGVSAAGCLGHGERAWVEFSMPETLHDDKSGLDYRPNLVKADSMDGSISLSTYLSCGITICGNTLTWNMLEAKRAGRLFKRKHTANFGGDLQSERDALGILEQVDQEFVSEVHALLERSVSDKQVLEVLDVIRPLPEAEGGPRTKAENRRDQWLSVYKSDPMVNQWKGTAFGVLQCDNTMDHWYDESRGDSRWERNTWRAINGKRGQRDRSVIAALEQVLV